MKNKIAKMTSRKSCVFYANIVCLILLAGCQLASAQWTVANVDAAWNGYNNAFYYTDSYGGYFRHIQGTNSPEPFWTFAEEIEMAEDAESWDATNNPGKVTADKNEILQLINGFRHLHTDNWSSDPYNDDLSVAVLAFIRCYGITGSGICLSDAETNHDTVYSRGYDTTLGGGLWWNNDKPSNPSNKCSTQPTDCIKGSSANWTFAIAGWLIDHYNGHTGNYLTHANTIYSWSTSHLYNSSTGLVYNDEDYQGNMNSGLVSYNFGLAIGAASYQNLTYGGQGSIITNMANYLMNAVNGGATVNGYELLPDYGQANNGYGAFNGMTFRWTGIANVYGYMPSSFVPWAQANIGQGWADRDSIALSWDDWIPDPPAGHSPNTPDTGLYSIDCTPMPVGMFWVPTP